MNERSEALAEYGDAFALCRAAMNDDRPAIRDMLSTYTTVETRGRLIIALAYVAVTLTRMLAEVTDVQEPARILTEMIRNTQTGAPPC